MEYIKINDRSFFRRHYLNPMIKSGQLKMTIPDKPKVEIKNIMFSNQLACTWSK